MPSVPTNYSVNIITAIAMTAKRGIPNANPQLSTLTPQLSTINYKIKGMTCNHCAANAQKVIASVEGVESVTVSLEDGLAHITGNFKEEDIIQAIESIGFSVK